MGAQALYTSLDKSPLRQKENSSYLVFTVWNDRYD